MLLALVLSALAVAPLPPSSLAPPDTLPDPPELVRAAPPAQDENGGVDVDFTFFPTSLYSGSRGFGIGGAVEVQNLGWDGSLIEVDALIAQHFFRGRTTVFSGDPYVNQLYGALGFSYTTAGRRNFFGIGPYTDNDFAVDLSNRNVTLEGRLGWYPVPEGPVLLQPVVSYRVDELRNIGPDAEDAANLIAQDALVVGTPNADNLNRAIALGSRTGVEFGFDAAFDTRDDLRYASSGVLAQFGLRRFDEFDGPGIGYFRYTGDLLGLLPLGARRVLFGRAHLAVTREDDSVMPDDLSYYYLPVLDNDLVTGFPGFRYVSRDLLTLGGGLRVPVLAAGPVIVDGIVRADLGAAYDDIGDQFKFGLSFDGDPPAAGADVDFRPSLALGALLLDGERNRVRVSGMVGFSPEGLNVATVTLNYDLRDFWIPGQ